MFNALPHTDPEAVAHVIQVALTPVFLLTGIAGLLAVFATRLGRVADRVDRLAERWHESEDDDELLRKLLFLKKRTYVLDVAVVLGALAGVAICAAALTLFLGAMRNQLGAELLFALFGLCLICTLGALSAFCTEMIMANVSVRREVSESSRKSGAGGSMEGTR
jgi:hypothetical protein